MALKVSPLAPQNVPHLAPIKGVTLAACEAGIKYKNRKDLMLIVMDEGTTIAGSLTRSKTASAPVEWCRQNLLRGGARALIVNSGNSNAFTGKKGWDTVYRTVEVVAGAVGCALEDVFIASTGVIGEPLDPQKFVGCIDGLVKDQKADCWQEAAAAIMTTDTFPKVAKATVEIDGVSVTLNGIAKGSGMIAPDMATMLSFVFTDAAVAPRVLQALCTQSVNRSFNAITVDGDTSTSDTLLLFATGKAQDAGMSPIVDLKDPRVALLAQALDEVMIDLAQQVVKDGEGASKFVTVQVDGAENDIAARKVALSIANSPLVKTAIAGEDANWGRVVMAVGKSGEAADRDKLSIWFGDICVARNGERAADYNEKLTSAYMKQQDLEIRVDLGLGKGRSTVWTCDLTHGYISINADYRS